MSSHETDLIERLHAVAEGFEMRAASPGEDVRRGRRRVRRNRGLAAGVSAIAVAVILGVTAAVSGQNMASPDRQEPLERPSVVVGAGPVWYDADGLHRGKIVEQTPVAIGGGALALVRSGALYLDPASGDVWFHPWGGDPRIVGHNSHAGPGGDPSGDTAVWFDRSDLVVYDTAAGEEISRVRQRKGVSGLTGDHNPAGNSFLQVSAERVVWRGWRTVFSYDVRTQATSEIEVPKDSYLVDVHDKIKVFNEDGSVLRVPGRVEQRFPELEAYRVRLSPSGNYAVAIQATETRHASAIIDIRTGELWPVPRNAYSYVAWSYDDIALVDTDDALLACDAVHLECEDMYDGSAYQKPTMPTN